MLGDWDLLGAWDLEIGIEKITPLKGLRESDED